MGNRFHLGETLGSVLLLRNIFEDTSKELFMEDKHNSNEFGEESNGGLPVHFRLMDIFLEQVEQSAPLLATVVKDVQADYIRGVHMVLKVGEALESKSKMNVNLIHGVSSTFDKVSPIITEAQLGVTEAIIESARQGVQLLRKSIIGRKNRPGKTLCGIQSGGSDGI